MPAGRAAGYLSGSPGDLEALQSLPDKNASAGHGQKDPHDHRGPNDGIDPVDLRHQFALRPRHGLLGLVEKDLIIFSRFECSAIDDQDKPNGESDSTSNQ